MDDDRLEDFPAAAVATEVEAWKALRTRLLAIPLAGLTPDEHVDHRIVGGLTDAWLLELETHRHWQKNLMPYAAAISDGVHNLMTMESSPAEVRARRIIDKLRGVPLLLAAARANITAPPRVMAERGVRMLRGASAMLTADVPLAFAPLTDTTLKGGLLAATTSAASEIDAFVRWFEAERLPQAGAPFAVGKAGLEARYRAEELIDLPVETLVAIGERELAVQEAAFVQAAAAVDARRPALAVWQDVLRNHPARGALVPAAQQAVDALQAFVVEKGLVTLPPSERVVVAAALFESRAHLPAPAARQEAERGTYDPTYGGYFLGKMAMLKLRDDVKAARGAAFDLRAFHEQVMRNGIAPLWAHRQLLLPGDTAPVLQ